MIEYFSKASTPLITATKQHPATRADYSLVEETKTSKVGGTPETTMVSGTPDELEGKGATEMSSQAERVAGRNLQKVIAKQTTDALAIFSNTLDEKLTKQAEMQAMAIASLADTLTRLVAAQAAATEQTMLKLMSGMLPKLSDETASASHAASAAPHSSGLTFADVAAKDGVKNRWGDESIDISSSTQNKTNALGATSAYGVVSGQPSSPSPPPPLLGGASGATTESSKIVAQPQIIVQQAPRGAQCSSEYASGIGNGTLARAEWVSGAIINIGGVRS